MADTTIEKIAIERIENHLVECSALMQWFFNHGEIHARPLKTDEDEELLTLRLEMYAQCKKSSSEINEGISCLRALKDHFSPVN